MANQIPLIVNAGAGQIQQLATGDNLSVAGNIVTGNILTDGYYYANGTPINFGGSYGNANVAEYLPTFTGNLAGNNISLTGNVYTDGKILHLGEITGNGITANGAGIVVGANVATILYDNSVFGWTVNEGWHPAANVTYNLGRTTRYWNNFYAVNVNAVDIAVSNSITVNNNINSNIISASGNITTAGYFVGNFQGNISGNLVVPGSNTQVLYNNDGNAGASSGLTFNSASNAMVVAGNVTASNFIGRLSNGTSRVSIASSGNVSVGVGPFSTTVLNINTSTGISVLGNIIASEYISATGNITGNYILGNGSQLTGLPSGYGNTEVAAYLAGSAGNIIPGANLTYSLGNSTNWWSNVWVAGNTIYIGGVPLGMGAGNVLTVDGNVVLSNDSNTSINTTGNITANTFFTTANLKIGTNPDIVVAGDHSEIKVFGSADTLQIGWEDTAPGINNIAYIKFNDYYGGIQFVTGNTQGTVHGILFDETGNLAIPGNIVSADSISLWSGDAVSITSNNTGLPNTWNFDESGNLTLPGNSFAVNYANGTQVSIGGGNASTGNVTFDNQIVIGTGDGFGDGGLYLAVGPTSVANLQYLQVRGGDVATHIHLDTGNSDFYDQYFGDDGKYVKLEAGAEGNVVIGTDGDGYNWTFDDTGNLTVPGNIKTTTIGPAFSSNVTDVDTTTTPGLVIIGLADNVFTTGAQGQVTITGVVGTTEANGTWYYQTVETNAIQLFSDPGFTIPVNGTLWTAYVSGGLAVAQDYYRNLSITGGAVSIVNSAGNAWTFGSTGNLLLAPQNVSGSAGESAILAGTRKIINGQYSGASYGYSAVLAAGGTPTVAYTATNEYVQSVRLTFAVESLGVAPQWEQFDVVATKSLDNPEVNFVVSNRIKARSSISDTVVTASYSSANQIEIILTLAAGQTGGWSSFDAVEFGLLFN